MLRNVKIATFQNGTQFTSQTEQIVRERKEYVVSELGENRQFTEYSIVVRQSATTILRSTIHATELKRMQPFHAMVASFQNET